MSTKVWVKPHWAKRVVSDRYVPPYTSAGTTIWSPGWKRRKADEMAAIPEAKANPVAPSSRAAIVDSRASLVGFRAREYMYPSLAAFPS